MTIRIRSKRNGFRRCGLAHPAQWTEHPDDAFTEKQLKILQEEPMLQVEIPKEGKGKKEAGKEQ